MKPDLAAAPAVVLVVLAAAASLVEAWRGTGDPRVLVLLVPVALPLAYLARAVRRV